MATYIEMVDMILDWSNRDREVLSYKNIAKFLDYAADNIYRDLRIAPLEYVSSYTISGLDSERRYNQLTVPSDAIEFIQLRKEDRNSLTGWTVYADKPDIRSFNQDYIFKSTEPYYARERNQFFVYPDLQNEDRFELLYYRRLADVDARYPIDSDTAATRVDTDSDSIAMARLYNPNTIVIDYWGQNDSDGTAGKRAMGAPVSNWLRDENEKLLLFGALAEAFTYLDDVEMAQKYAARFSAEMENLNDEDMMRKYKGGHIQTHFYGPLI